jgi:hypothetical protein
MLSSRAHPLTASRAYRRAEPCILSAPDAGMVQPDRDPSQELANNHPPRRRRIALADHKYVRLIDLGIPVGTPTPLLISHGFWAITLHMTYT